MITRMQKEVDSARASKWICRGCLLPERPPKWLASIATSFFMRLRHLIAGKLPGCESSGEVEADESYFGGIRKGRRGRGASGEEAVFG